MKVKKKRASRYISSTFLCPKCGSGDTYQGTETVVKTTGMVGTRVPNTPFLAGRTISTEQEKTVRKCKKCDARLGSKDESGGYTEYQQDDGSWAENNPDYTSEGIGVIAKIVVSLILAVWGVSEFEETKDDSGGQVLFGIVFFVGSYFILSMLGLAVLAASGKE